MAYKNSAYGVLGLGKESLNVRPRATSVHRSRSSSVLTSYCRNKVRACMMWLEAELAAGGSKQLYLMKHIFSLQVFLRGKPAAR